LSSVLASNIDVDQSRIELPWPKPHPIKKRVPLTTKEILKEFRSEGILRNWRVELEHDYAGDGTFAEHLVLRVRFRSFLDAIRFMSEFASECDRQHHHPIWENIHRNLTIKLRTFDAGHRVSHFDLQMAEKINRALQTYDVKVM
jgi:pterin-4a-carbinolamine dehydratase